MILRSTRTILILVSLAFLAAACVLPTPAVLPLITPTSAASSDADWFSIYFSNPDSPTAFTYRGGPDDKLATAIREARFSVDAAIYHINLWSIRDALIAAHNAGVTVRVVAETKNMDETEIQELRQAGIPIVEDHRESFMHNKFMVIDNHEVWTSSMNFTVNGAYKNDNNLLRIRSSKLAENYTTEFNEMFEQGMFGDHAIANTPHPSITLDGSQVETYFSPDDGAAARIVRLIQNAQTSVSFMAFSFTSDQIAAALLERAENGVNIVGVFDESQYYSNAGTEFDNLYDAGLAVYLDQNIYNMHHKVIIIDRKIVITGSYNFSYSAEQRNDENVLIIHNAQAAESYLDEFERVLAKAISE
ncbi:MAG: phospholipase D-like domain-containing protein [Chloroflexota bacterium]